MIRDCRCLVPALYIRGFLRYRRRASQAFASCLKEITPPTYHADMAADRDDSEDLVIALVNHILNISTIWGKNLMIARQSIRPPICQPKRRNDMPDDGGPLD
jgi:hypothetical protein